MFEMLLLSKKDRLCCLARGKDLMDVMGEGAGGDLSTAPRRGPEQPAPYGMASYATLPTAEGSKMTFLRCFQWSLRKSRRSAPERRGSLGMLVDAQVGHAGGASVVTLSYNPSTQGAEA